ncbi:MAG: single-stranded DNA-binding protein [Salana multivorans]|nr:single-stranded DNA-binding protein [Salana multivorans]
MSEMRVEQGLRGNVTRAPEFTRPQARYELLSFGLAQNHGSQVDGEYVRGEPTFTEVVVWGVEAVRARDLIAMGDPVILVGEFTTDPRTHRETGEKYEVKRFTASRVGLDVSDSRFGARFNLARLPRAGEPSRRTPEGEHSAPQDLPAHTQPVLDQ